MEIWKYTMVTQNHQNISMPKGAKILSAQAQGIDNICIWVEVDPNTRDSVRTFEIYGTGHPMKELRAPLERKFIGTCQLYHGSLVFHVYELINPT